MKVSTVALCVALVALGAVKVNAEEKQVEVIREVQTVDQLNEAEFAQRMQAAEERLAEAAQRVAELSSSRLESVGDYGRYAYEFSDNPRIGVNIGSEGDDGPVEGVRIISVTPGGAAADAGLRADDVITSINGEKLSANTSRRANERLFEFMRGVKAGDTLTLEYLRDGNSNQVELEPRPVAKNVFVWAPDDRNLRMPGIPKVHVMPDSGERFRYTFGGWSSGWGDMEVVKLTAGLGRYFGTDSGLLVISAPSTNDFKLQEGDVIQSIDGRVPSSVDHCMRILGSYQPGETLELKIMRDKRKETLTIAMPERKMGALPVPVEPLARGPAAAPAYVPTPAPAAPETTVVP